MEYVALAHYADPGDPGKGEVDASRSERGSKEGHPEAVVRTQPSHTAHLTGYQVSLYETQILTARRERMMLLTHMAHTVQYNGKSCPEFLTNISSKLL